MASRIRCPSASTCLGTSFAAGQDADGDGLTAGLDGATDGEADPGGDEDADGEADPGGDDDAEGEADPDGDGDPDGGGDTEADGVGVGAGARAPP